MNIQVQDLNHLGIIAGIIDEMGVVGEIDRQVGKHPQQIVSTGEAVKAMILNGLGFVSAPLYLFGQFFVGKATEHLLGGEIRAEDLNDDRLGRALDDLWEVGLTQLFSSVAMAAYRRFGVSAKSVHLDSSSFMVYGQYETGGEEEGTEAVAIVHGYSKDHRPDLKQFLVDLICTGDGDVPLFLRVGDGTESDKAVFAQLLQQFRQQWDFEGIYVADSALYSEENLQELGALRWLTRVPLTLKAAQALVDSIDSSAFQPSQLSGYHIAECCSNYAGVQQRWLVIESDKRRDSDLKQFNKRLDKQYQKAHQLLRHLMTQEFHCPKDAQQAATQLGQNWPYHRLDQLELIALNHYGNTGRPRKDQSPQSVSYRLKAVVVSDPAALALAQRRCGRFILATNVLAAEALSHDDALQEYKGQQSSERGFRFLKDPLFFTSSVFLKTPQRVAALALVMGLCLLVYTLGQRLLRQSLTQANATIPNQLGKPTSSPTLRWVFQSFQAIHLVWVNGIKQISNLTETRLQILRFMGAACLKYYLLC